MKYLIVHIFNCIDHLKIYSLKKIKYLYDFYYIILICEFQITNAYSRVTNGRELCLCKGSKFGKNF